jgi:hypothetical protein
VSESHCIDRVRYFQEMLCRAIIALLVFVASIHVLAGWSLAAETTGQDRSDFNQRMAPILEKYCYDCHGRKQTEGDVKLTEFASWADLEKRPQLIEGMIDALGQNEMPPEEMQQPSDKQRQFMLLELDKALRNATANTRQVVPLRLRRMNRFEYGNAVRDLFQLRCWVYSINDRIIRNHNDYFRPESGEMPEVVQVGNRIMGLQQLLENRLLGVMPFPKDPPAENGFNNRGDHLSMSPSLMESLLELSQSVVNAENFDENCGVWSDLFGDPANPEPATRVVDLTADSSVMARSTGLTLSAWIRPTETPDAWQSVVRREDGWRRQLLAIGRTGKTWGLWMGAGIAGHYEEFGAPVDPKLLADGNWHHVAGTFDGKQLNLYVDGKQIGNKAIEGKLHTESRKPMLVGSFGNETFHGELNDVRLFRSGLTSRQIKSLAAGDRLVAQAEMVGGWKLDDGANPKPTPSELKTLAHVRIQKFLRKAFRASVDQQTLKLYTEYFDKRYNNSGDFTQSMKDVVSGAMASPRFIFVHNQTNESLPNQSSLQLATRLSYFLWSSIPDDELLALAETGKLRDPEVLKTQVDRMLNHRRVKNFCDSFAPQWLKINNLVTASPDFKTHREYYFGGDDKISYKRGMHMMLEPLLNFETVFVENRPISELVDADFTYRSHLLSEWNEGRAATYAVNVNLRDIDFTRIQLDDRRYGGVITTPAVMVMTSSPFRSLPITRGSWVASVIFNDPPEPPPDTVPELKADDDTLQQQGLTVRQKLKQHRSAAECAGCHKRIDPLGFALENYDLLGRWRDNYRTGLKVDARGKLFGKHAFNDVVGFKGAILAEEDVFAQAFVEHLLSYALGRALTVSDRIAAGEIARASKKEDYKMRDVIRNLVLHDVFVQKVTE